MVEHGLMSAITYIYNIRNRAYQLYFKPLYGRAQTQSLSPSQINRAKKRSGTGVTADLIPPRIWSPGPNPLSGFGPPSRIWSPLFIIEKGDI